MTHALGAAFSITEDLWEIEMLEPKWGMSSQHQFKLTAIFPPGCSHGVPTVGVWKQIRPAGPGAQEPPRAAQRPLPIYVCHSNFVELWTCAAQLDQKARHSLAHTPKLRSKSRRIFLPSRVTNMDLMLQLSAQSSAISSLLCHSNCLRECFCFFFY